MAIKFNCSSCGGEIILRYLHEAENATCRKCGNDNKVPDNAQDIPHDQADAEYMKQDITSASIEKRRVETRILEDMVPTITRVGKISVVIAGIGAAVSGNIFWGIIGMVLGIMSVIALCTLLEGVGTIIVLLRKIAKK